MMLSNSVATETWLFNLYDSCSQLFTPADIEVPVPSPMPTPAVILHSFNVVLFVCEIEIWCSNVN